MKTQYYEVLITAKQCIINGVVVQSDDFDRVDDDFGRQIVKDTCLAHAEGRNWLAPAQQTPLSEVLGKLNLENVWHGAIIPMTPDQRLFAEHNVLTALVVLLYSEGDSL